mmetsp:Transcript_27731/g.41964  ORF Transcript_27731/g.41964 Transcript_27731/m.41964 type:complete len:94 (-) Transcript_27731:791-1072(-)
MLSRLARNREAASNDAPPVLFGTGIPRQIPPQLTKQSWINSFRPLDTVLKMSLTPKNYRPLAHDFGMTMFIEGKKYGMGIWRTCWWSSLDGWS